MSSFNESPEQKFKRLASIRTNQVLDKIRILGNCSNKQVYKCTKKDIDKIFSAIEKKLRETKAKFNQFDAKEQFKL